MATLWLGCRQADPPIFVERAAETGLEFRHYNGMSGKFYIAEIMGAGAALFDYDNDGDLDVYLVQGNVPEPDRGHVNPDPSVLPLRDRLFRNDLEIRADGQRTSRFTDVTEESGIRVTDYGMGVAAGDYNNDGWVDLYVTGHGPNHLLRNNGDGSFTDVTDESGAAETRWSVAAVFTDLDRDGWLDLYIGNYLDYTFANNKICFNGGSNYCNPLSYRPAADRLLRNRGDGTFEDISTLSGLGAIAGNSLGVAATDFNQDGWVDLYVANDGEANFLWLNQANGRFVESALLSGCALNQAGQPEASMGVDAGDFDGDGDEDLFMTHLAGETNTIYVNNGQGFFEDRTIQTGLGSPSKLFTGFGTAWFDYDNDGLLDLLVVNGAVTTIAELVAKNDPYPLHQPNQLFHNLGDGRFVETSDAAGPAFLQSEVSRGAAFGDIDNDGDTDVLVTNNNGPVRLLENRIGSRNQWLGVVPMDAAGKRILTGARAGLRLKDGRVLWRRARTEASYASANDPRILFGLNRSAEAVEVEILWPDGAIEVWRNLTPDRYHVLRQGTASPQK